MKNLLIESILFLLLPNMTFATDLNFSIFPKQCAVNKIVKKLPIELKPRIEIVSNIVNKISKQLKVNPCLILSMVWAESTFKASQRSFKGADGLMQVMPRTASAMRLKLNYDLNKMISANIGYGLDFWEVENLVIGTYYYSKLLKKYNGNRKKALIAYNMGSTYVANNYASDNHNYFKKVSGKFNLITVND